MPRILIPVNGMVPSLDTSRTEEKGARVINTSTRYKDLAFAFPAAWTVQLAVLYKNLRC